MGYRTYVGYINKDKHKKVNNLSKEELTEYYKLHHTKDYEETEGYICLRQLLDGDTYKDNIQVPTIDFEDSDLINFFKDKTIIERYEGAFFILKREGLLKLINHMSSIVSEKHKTIFQTIEIFNKLIEVDGTFSIDEYLSGKERYELYEAIQSIRGNSFQWYYEIGDVQKNNTPYRLDKKPNSKKEINSIVTSNKFEYIIFDLINLYNTFDWENNYIVYYGY